MELKWDVLFSPSPWKRIIKLFVRDLNLKFGIHGEDTGVPDGKDKITTPKFGKIFDTKADMDLIVSR